MRNQQLRGGVVGIDEDGELVVAHVPQDSVEAAEVEVAGLGGLLEGEEDR